MSLTNDQLAAVTAEGKLVCVDAGAGSGKTRVLVSRIVHLIERCGVELDQIAAITFTDKAAAEMKSRLRQAFRQKAPEDDPSAFSFWRRMERQVDTARISTIHSFCSRILRENALSLGMDPDFSILTEAESQMLRRETVTATVHDALDASDSDARLLAVEFGIARVISTIEAMLIKRGVVNRILEQIPLQTAADVQAHWKKSEPLITAEILRGHCRSAIFRSCLRRLESLDGSCDDPSDKREQQRIELIALLRQLCAATDVSTIRKILARLDQTRAEGRSHKAWKSRESYDCVRDVLGKLRNEARGLLAPQPDDFLESRAAEVTAALVRLYGRTDAALSNAKRSRNALDYDDLISDTARVLQKPGQDGTESVCERTARSLRHLLIDEFQDTDGVQYAIARCIADVAGGPDLFIVGDGKQSIYLFRGAEVDVFEQARGSADHKLPMLENWRTAAPILNFVNDYFERSQMLWSVESTYRPLTPSRDVPGLGTVEFLLPPEQDEGGKEAYREAEAAMIAMRLREMIESGVPVGDRNGTRPCRYGDAAILLRALSDVHIYERALREAGVPYTLVAGKGFYERQEVVDLRNLLTVVADPCDEIALLGFLRGPMVGLSDDAIVQLVGGIGAPTSLLQAFAGSYAPTDAGQQRRLARARELIAELRANVELPLPQFMQLAMRRSGCEGIVLRQFMGAQRASNLRKVCALAESYSRLRSPRLRGFLRYLDEMAAEEIREGEAAAHSDETNTVTLMTVHKAKGLEFPILFIADMARDAARGTAVDVAIHKRYGIAAKAASAKGEIESPAMYSAICDLSTLEEHAEQGRILYVAMTRARDHLFLCGGAKTLRESCWLWALDDELGLLSRAHDEYIFGKNWKARINRVVPRIARAASARTRTQPVDVERVRRQIAPAEMRKPLRVIVASTELVRALAPESAPPQDGRDKARRGIDALRRGVIVHAFLQQWDFRSAPDAAIASVLRAEALDSEDDARLRRELADIAARVGSHALGRQIASATHIERELPFLLRVDTAIISGTIDLLLDDECIIDYKTGVPNEAEKAVYAAQLQLYASAVRRLCDATELRAQLVYVDQPEHFLEPVDVSETACSETLKRLSDALSRVADPQCAEPERVL